MIHICVRYVKYVRIVDELTSVASQILYCSVESWALIEKVAEMLIPFHDIARNMWSKLSDDDTRIDGTNASLSWSIRIFTNIWSYWMYPAGCVFTIWHQ